MLEQKDFEYDGIHLKGTEESILERVDEKLLKSESLVLGEIEHTQTYLEKHTERV